MQSIIKYILDSVIVVNVEEGDKVNNEETVEQQLKDSDMIFTQISTSAIDTFEDAKRLIVIIYVPDMEISRSGISHALGRLDFYYTAKES